MSASKTHSAASVGFDSAALPAASPFGLPCRQSITGLPKPSGSSTPGLARCRGLVSSDAATATEERRPRWAGRARSVIRPGGAGALLAAGGVLVPARCEHRPCRSTAWRGSLFPVAGCRVAATLRRAFVITTAPAGCVAGWRWTCPRFGEALCRITRVEVLGRSEAEGTALAGGLRLRSAAR